MMIERLFWGSLPVYQMSGTILYFTLFMYSVYPARSFASSPSSSTMHQTITAKVTDAGRSLNTNRAQRHRKERDERHGIESSECDERDEYDHQKRSDDECTIEVVGGGGITENDVCYGATFLLGCICSCREVHD